MFKNLFKTAIRHIRKHPGYSFLNIAGLSLGIASALFIIIYIADEISYDRYHEKAERIFRVSSAITESDDQFTWIVAQIPFGPQVVHDYPEVESYVRFINMPRTVYRYDDHEYNEDDFYYVDSTLFDIFTYEVVRGEVESALREPNKIILTETVASRYFGRTDPIGKTLETDDNSYEITGVIKDVPSNSHFRFDAVTSRNNLPEQIGSWGNFGVFTYLLFPESTDIKAFEAKMQEMYTNYMEPIFGSINITIEYHLEPLTRIHLYSTNAGEPEPTGSITYVYIFTIVAFFLILIAAMNYMNLATARSLRRAREVSLRKVSGSQRGFLIIQFLIESTTLTVISLIISLVVIVLLLPRFNLLAGKSFDYSVLYSPVVCLSIVGIVFFAGILGGSYPAFFLSGFTPVAILKGTASPGPSGSLFRKTLVVIQFTVSTIMVICTLVVFKQLYYLRNEDQGFNQKNIVTLRLDREMVNKYPVMKQLLLEDPGIRSVCSTDTPIGEGSGKVVFNLETDQGMSQRGVNYAIVDHDFIETMEIEIIEGRDFRIDMPSDTLRGIIVNETLVDRMGWNDPIGKKIELGDENTLRARVIGVMKDYHQTGMYNETESLLLAYNIENNIVYIRYDEENIAGSMDYIREVWEEVFPDVPYNYTILSERFNSQFEADEKRGFIFTLFTILAILISCLGLFGLASYMVEQRTKEIGIRKVFGADERNILLLILKDFLLLILISIFVAIPSGYLFMDNWLSNYVYKTVIGAGLLVFSVLVIVLISVFTISFKAYQASVLNPADSVRTE